MFSSLSAGLAGGVRAAGGNITILPSSVLTNSAVNLCAATASFNISSCLSAIVSVHVCATLCALFYHLSHVRFNSFFVV